MDQTTATDRFGKALSSAARAYGRRLTASEPVTLGRVEAQALLIRLGLPCGLAAPEGPDAPPVPVSQIEPALTRLHKESRRLARLARARHPAYDLNRHIAVRRLLRALASTSASQTDPGPQGQPAASSRTGRRQTPFRPAKRLP